MNTAEGINNSADNRTSDGRKQSPPAFLDLADSVCMSLANNHAKKVTLFQAARLGTNMPDISAVSGLVRKTVGVVSILVVRPARGAEEAGTRTSACYSTEDVRRSDARVGEATGSGAP